VEKGDEDSVMGRLLRALESWEKENGLGRWATEGYRSVDEDPDL